MTILLNVFLCFALFLVFYQAKLASLDMPERRIYTLMSANVVFFIAGLHYDSVITLIVSSVNFAGFLVGWWSAKKQYDKFMSLFKQL